MAKKKAPPKRRLRIGELQDEPDEAVVVAARPGAPVPQARPGEQPIAAHTSRARLFGLIGAVLAAIGLVVALVLDVPVTVPGEAQTFYAFRPVTAATPGVVFNLYATPGQAIQPGTPLLQLGEAPAVDVPERVGPAQIDADGYLFTYRSAIRGRVSDMPVRMGAVVDTGDVMLTLVEDGTPPAVILLVDPADTARIDPGQEVTLRLGDGPTLKGTVAEVDPRPGTVLSAPDRLALRIALDGPAPAGVLSGPGAVTVGRRPLFSTLMEEWGMVRREPTLRRD